MESDERPAKMRKLRHDDREPGNAKMQTPGSSHDESKSGETGDISKMLENENVEDSDEEGGVAIAGGAEKVDLPMPDQTAPALASVGFNPDDPPLSKNQQKKLRKKAEWEAKREERKAIRKEKNVARKERRRAEKRAEEANPDFVPSEPKKQPQTHAVQLPVTIAIDCDFDDLMLDNERISLAAQITRCYSDNRKALFRAHLTYCSFGGKLKERFDTVLAKNYLSFKGVRALDCDFVETAENAKEWMSTPEGGKLAGMFSKYADLDDEAKEKLKEEGEVVYLSSEADEDLTELKPYSTYIIGGLVDKNREKGVCHRRATQRGVRTARLPIGQYMQMQSRKVLATNHVNEIMVKWLECGDWGQAFMKAIPKRKGGSLKNEEGAEGGENFNESAQPDGWDDDAEELAED